jgi:hypothetical protein
MCQCINLLRSGKSFWHGPCDHLEGNETNVASRLVRLERFIEGKAKKFAKELAMRKMMLTLVVGLGTLVAGTSTAMAHGFDHHAYYHRPEHHFYRPAYRYPVGVAPGYVHAPDCGAGYGVSPYYGAPSVGLTTRNFGLWLTP